MDPVERRSQISGDSIPFNMVYQWQGLPLYIGKRNAGKLRRLNRKWPYDWREKYKYI